MNSNLPIIISFLSIIALISCDSGQPKPDTAFESFKENKLMIKGSDSTDKVIIKNPKKSDQEQNPDDWTKFKAEMERKIIKNEHTIKEIKGIPNGNTELYRKASRIEKDNNELRKQMDDYHKKMQVGVENFKATMYQDMAKISVALKDLAVNNKK